MHFFLSFLYITNIKKITRVWYIVTCNLYPDTTCHRVMEGHSVVFTVGRGMIYFATALPKNTSLPPYLVAY